MQPADVFGWYPRGNHFRHSWVKERVLNTVGRRADSFPTPEPPNNLEMCADKASCHRPYESGSLRLSDDVSKSLAWRILLSKALETPKSKISLWWKAAGGMRKSFL